MSTTLRLQLYRSNMGGVAGEKSTEPPRCQLLAATALWDSPAETCHNLEKRKALLHSCRAHAPCPQGHGPETTTPGPQALKCFQVRPRRGGGGSLWAPSFVPGPSRIYFQGSKRLCPFPDKRPLSWRDELVNKGQEGGLDRQAHHRSLPTPSASECSQLSAAVPARCPTRKAH